MKRWRLVGVVLLVTLIVLLDLIYRHHAHAESWWHVTPAFDLVYGFIGCVAIILISKWMGQAWLQRGEDFYEDHTP
ncbi:MAG: hypothetical protein O7G88_23565 [bacterium]|nr:hypothetical protein [bacterium]